MAKYVYHEEDGFTGEIDAADMDQAVRVARRLAESGDWGYEGARISVLVVELDADGDKIDSRDIVVDIEPDHEYLIRQAGGDPDCDHEWTSEGEGGCDENPGVWSTGGTSMEFHSHCTHCGLRRTEYTTGSQHNHGEHDRVEYFQPDEDADDGVLS